MNNNNIFREAWEIEPKLLEFGVTKAEWIQVALKAATARNDSVVIDPINAPGQLAYIFGTRAIREVLLPKKKWKIDRTDNIEATFNPETGIKIIYQNVDLACSNRTPKAISGKGIAAKRMVENATGYLFQDMEKERVAQINSKIWFFCVSVNGDDIRAELSRPRSIEGNQFDEFLERIFIINGNEWDDPNNFDDEDNFDAQDFDIVVTKK